MLLLKSRKRVSCVLKHDKNGLLIITLVEGIFTKDKYVATFSGHAALPQSGEKRLAISNTAGPSGASSRKKPKQGLSSAGVSSVPTANLDADDPWDQEDYTEDDQEETSKVHEDSDDNASDDSDDDDEDEAALLAELAKIKRERAEEAAQEAARKKADDETIRMENILNGNPLLNNANSSSGTFSSYTCSVV